ncbi:FEKKY domain-containing protein [Joostella sp. CR20]|uniref:FEKKY domain-containing protein n=1 Tax=Joostella sp. CR20 TaxID=2804312 RepID=UPI00313BB9DC
MRNIIFILAFTLFSLASFAKEIEVTIVFEKFTEKENISAELLIIETNQRIEINQIENFKVTLPEKGKYKFSFISKDFIGYTTYPKRINEKNNTVTIKLFSKSELAENGIYVPSLELETDLTDEQIKQRIESGTLNFIMHGIDSSVPKEYLEFKEKYGIGLVKKNCMIDPLSFKNTIKNNQMIYEYMNRIYGTEWLNELTSKPFGIK